ncbi:hypothetical protein [Cellulosilyticum sp. I15G10I2]|uniref:hypothetical protein n=1 Tax=Cellulosilyticum sp. I15G10I2 TaxID=1892843 RepID=UPI00085CAC71|nr:hypothetical protein [Cellulosilyticum sp. I15G10I2]
MTNLLKLRLFVSITLSIIIMFTAIPLKAANSSPVSPTPTAPTELLPPSPTSHREAISRFISEINQIQSQVFDIAILAQVNPPEFEQRLTNNISFINRRIEELNTSVLEYLTTVPSIGEQNTHVLFVINALNFVKNSLYSLSALSQTTANIVRIRLLDEYFRSRLAGIDTLNTVISLILQYNP